MPAQLSGGQQQRVAVARALVFEPQADPDGRAARARSTSSCARRCSSRSGGLHERLGVTMVYVTHDQSEALTMSDRIAVFQHGRIQQLDDPRRLYERPVNPFVASFIGENNRLKARFVEDSDAGECAVQIEGGATVRGHAAGAVPGPGARSPCRCGRSRSMWSRHTTEADADNRLPARVARDYLSRRPCARVPADGRR